MRQANLQPKPSNEVVFLGHLVSPVGMTCDPEKKKIAAMKDWPQPRDKTEIKAFLGLVGYDRKNGGKFC